MDNFENKLIRGIHVSRYVASWYNVGGKIYGGYATKVDPITKKRITHRFHDWLRTLVIDSEHLTEEEIYYIHYYATNGKLELQESAKKFLEN